MNFANLFLYTVVQFSKADTKIITNYSENKIYFQKKLK